MVQTGMGAAPDDRASPAVAWYPLEVSKRVIVSRVLRNGEADDGSFDRQFWKELGHEAILAAAWEMVEEARAMREESGSEPRLQRSVCRVIRRAS